MPDEQNPYSEPFYQTLLLTTSPIDAVASRLIVDAASRSMSANEVPNRRMVLMAPIRSRVGLPDWKPDTLSEYLNVATEADPGEVPPLEAVTGGPDVTIDDLKARMHEQIELGIEQLTEAQTLLASENSLHNARNALQNALSSWTMAEMLNLRLYSVQFKLAQAKADPDVDRG